MKASIFTAFVLSASAVRALGQSAVPPTVSSIDGFTPAVMEPGTPAGSYILGDFDTVNIANLHVNFRFPLIKIGGRGTASTVLMPNFTKMWRVFASYQPSCNQQGCTPNWTYSILNQDWETIAPIYGVGRMIYRQAGYLCQPAQAPAPSSFQTTLTRLTFISADGTETEFVDQNTGGQPESQSFNTPGFDRGRIFVSRDGTSSVFTSTSDIVDPGACSVGQGGVSGTLLTRDGTQYTISYGYVTQITDRNGNTITYSGINSSSTITIADASGRAYQVLPNQFDSSRNLHYDEFTYPGANGATRVIKIYYDALHNHLRADQGGTQGVQTLWPGILLSPGGQSDPSIISDIDLPDGSSYQFLYDTYSDVARVVLPTGGAIEYDYTSFQSGGAQTQYNTASDYTLARQLSQRREYSNGTTLSRVTKYSGQTVSDYDGNSNLLSKVVHTINSVPQTPDPNPLDYTDWNVGEETKTQYYGSDGKTLLREIDRAYLQRSCTSDSTCWFTQSVNSGLNNYSASVNGVYAPAHDPQLITETTFEGGEMKMASYGYDVYNNRNDERYFDWNSGAPGSLLREVQTTYNTGSNYIASNILGLPTQTNVLNGSGTVVAETTYGYDATAPSPTYSPVSGFTAPAGPRGNRTSVSQCLNTVSCSWLTTTYGFDSVGNVVSVKDANGNTYILGYNDNYSDGTSRNSHAHVTSIKNPLNQTAYWQYDYGTGKASVTTDLNGVQAAYTFADSLDRLTQIRKAANTPVEAQTNVVYTGTTQVDVFGSLNSTTDNALHSQILYDGLGRAYATTLFESGTSYISTLTTYDALGRLATKSNPARPGDTQYVATNAYDGLGRITSVTAQDGSVTTTAYAGNVTTMTDPDGHVRKLTSDGLDNLTIVVEDPSGFGYNTSYSYSALGDLTGVTQGALSRSFVYDSLKRLTSATNPETGTISYSYDPVGNLKTKTDNRGIVTTYNYEALNRLTSKSYSDGTPTVNYTYDPGGSYGVGHLGSASNANSVTNYLLFDQLGRVTSSNQVNGIQTYTFGYGYNFASDLTSETYPSGRVVSFAYDRANRLSGANGQFGNQATAYASNFTYAAFGQPTNYQYGNGLARVMSYNPRLQIQNYTDQSNNNSATPLFSAALIWTDVNNHNNGNLQGVTYTYSGSGFSSPATFSDTFTYDNVNRLSVAADMLAGVTKWLQNYAYDPYGNMRISSSTGITLPGNAPNVNTTFNNNRLVGGTYDLAGNQTLVNGNTLTYDAEGREVSNVSNGSETYAYDGNSNRVRKSNSAGASTFVYDALGLLAMEISSVATVPACWTCYLSDDHLGSTRLSTDGSGNVIARHDYLPFGYEIQASDNVGRGSQFGAYDNVNQKFTSKERDPESGLDYFGARYYGSALGRFTSPDWSAVPQPVPYADFSNPQSLNQYAYVLNNPLSRADADGHCFPLCLALAGGGALAEESPLLFAGPPGWTVLAGTAIVVGGVALYQHLHTSQSSANSNNDATTTPPSEANPAPTTDTTPLPTGLMGSDPRPTKGRTNSGPLAPDNGGSGDAGKDFGTLTGGKNGSAPQGSTYPPGTQVGDNGVALRPAAGKSGARIDIPANGDKPHETLHYPPPPPPPPTQPKP